MTLYKVTFRSGYQNYWASKKHGVADAFPEIQFAIQLDAESEGEPASPITGIELIGPVHLAGEK